MPKTFQADGRPLLIGSLPLDDHARALDLVLAHTPEIPLWVQLPSHRAEGMLVQFAAGLPGLTVTPERVWVDTAREGFDDELLRFFETYLAVTEDGRPLEETVCALTPATAAGFFELLARVPELRPAPVALKGQVTGPITFCTGLKDPDGRALYYDEQLRDVAVKLLAMKARWQVERLAAAGFPVLLFIDEPALAAFGSSEMLGIPREAVIAALDEVIDAVHAASGLAGIHVCANTDWSMILETGVDIVNFDAYSYFERLVLFADPLRAFLDAGRILAWGIVPTAPPETVAAATADDLVARWEQQAAHLSALGIGRDTLLRQSLITPSCGTGTLALDLTRKVLTLTQTVSERLRRGR